MWPAASSTIASRFAADSSNEDAVGRDVAVVEAEERHAELLEELERGRHLLLRPDHRIELRAGSTAGRSVPSPKMSDPGHTKLCQ